MPIQKYRIDTDKGSYEIEVEQPAQAAVMVNGQPMSIEEFNETQQTPPPSVPAQFGRAVLRGAASVVDPRTYIAFAQEKRAEEDAWAADIASRMNGQAPPPKTWAEAGRELRQDVGALGRSLATPEGAGEVVGVLGVGALVPGAWRVGRAKVRAVQQTKRTALAGRATGDVLHALPPARGAAYTPGDIAAARPYLEAAAKETPITSVQTFRDAADRAIATIEGHVRTYVDAFPTDLIRTNPLDDVVSELRQSVRREFLERGLSELSDLPLDRPLTIREAEAIRAQLNAENRAILNRNNYDQATARKADPGFAAREAAVKSLREGIYNQLDVRGVEGVRQLRQHEGSIIRLRNAAERQVFHGDANVPGTAKSGPIRRAVASVAKYTTTAGGAAVGGAPGAVIGATMGDDLAAVIKARALKRDELIARAFRESFTDAPTYPARPTPAPVRGLLGSGPLVTPPPADRSFVRSVPADVVQRPLRALPPAPRQMPPGPDPSFVRGVPADADVVRRPRHGLPPAPHLMPAPETSGGGAVRASKYVTRDPRTGRFKVVYRGE